MRYLPFFPAVLSALAGAIGAFAQGTSGQNAITYPLGGSLDSNVPLTITWTPTTQGTITINLLKGPPSNLVDLGPIAASINNDGTFTWTIPSSLQDSGAMPKGDRYGFKIIDDATKTFEYSPPFDLSIPGSTFGGATASGSLSATASPTTSVSSAPSSSISATPTPTPASTTTQESTTSTSEFFASTTTPPAPTSTDLPSDILPNSVDTSPQSTLAATATGATPTPSQSKVAETLTPNPGPNVMMIIGVSAGAFAGLALLIVAVVVFVKCRKRRSRARARAPLTASQPPMLSMRGYGDGPYNRV